MWDETKKYRLQEQPKPFVLVHFSAWASLENNVNKLALAAPVIYTFWVNDSNCQAWGQTLNPSNYETIFSCEEAALEVLMSVCPSECVQFEI